MSSITAKQNLLKNYFLAEKREEIEARLRDFRAIPPALYLREVALCLLTPQSSPLRAESAMSELERGGLFQKKLKVGEVAEILRKPSHYIRFHNTKAKRLLEFVDQAETVSSFLVQGAAPSEERKFLVSTVKGLGMKEASHALRNIGRAGLSILDRHILNCLYECGAIPEIPDSLSVKRYLAIEECMKSFAERVEEDIDLLDLLFWSKKTGIIFK